MRKIFASSKPKFIASSSKFFSRDLELFKESFFEDLRSVDA